MYNQMLPVPPSYQQIKNLDNFELQTSVDLSHYSQPGFEDDTKPILPMVIFEDMCFNLDKECPPDVAHLFTVFDTKSEIEDEKWVDFLPSISSDDTRCSEIYFQGCVENLLTTRKLHREISCKECNAPYNTSPYSEASQKVPTFDQSVVTKFRGKKRKRSHTQSQREAATMRERKRVKTLNSAFQDLRDKVPTFSYETNLSRLETLRLAVTYIGFLTDVLKGTKPNDVRLRRRNDGGLSAIQRLCQLR